MTYVGPPGSCPRNWACVRSRFILARVARVLRGFETKHAFARRARNAHSLRPNFRLTPSGHSQSARRASSSTLRVECHFRSRRPKREAEQSDRRGPRRRQSPTRAPAFAWRPLRWQLRLRRGLAGASRRRNRAGGPGAKPRRKRASGRASAPRERSATCRSGFQWRRVARESVLGVRGRSPRIIKRAPGNPRGPRSAPPRGRSPPVKAGCPVALTDVNSAAGVRRGGPGIARDSTQRTGRRPRVGTPGIPRQSQRAGELARGRFPILREPCRYDGRVNPRIPGCSSNERRGAPRTSTQPLGTIPQSRRRLEAGRLAEHARPRRARRRPRHHLVANRAAGAGTGVRGLGHHRAVGVLANPDQRRPHPAVDGRTGDARPPAVPVLLGILVLFGGTGSVVADHRVFSQPRPAMTQGVYPDDGGLIVSSAPGDRA